MAAAAGPEGITTRDGSVHVSTAPGKSAEYEIQRAIGKGKFSTVYRATRKSDGLVVAMKRVQIMDLMDEKTRDKCLKEIALVQSLDHPNIIKHLDSFIEGRELLLVLEYAEAGDLKRQLRKALERQARFDERVIWKYFAQIAEAMAHMHARRIMHRDLKPANIFLTLNGTVKVGDLGLGRIFSEQTAEAFSKVGTPLYMSPEVLGGKGYEWKSDVWSLGCVLYELAMLHSPFKEEGLSLYGLFQKITKGEYPPISEVYSPQLRKLVADMLQLDPAARPDVDEISAIAVEMRERTRKPEAGATPAVVSSTRRDESPARDGFGGAPGGVLPSPSLRPGSVEAALRPGSVVDGHRRVGSALVPFRGDARAGTPSVTAVTMDGSHIPSRIASRRGVLDLGLLIPPATDGPEYTPAVDRPRAGDEGDGKGAGDDGGDYDGGGAGPRGEDGAYGDIAVVAGGAAPGEGEAGAGAGAIDGVALALMDSIVDRLQCLDYVAEFCVPWKQKPLSRAAFAIPVNNKTAFVQFPTLVTLCSWLLLKLGCEFGAKKTDDPVTTARALLTAMERAGCPTSVTGVLTPHLLVKASGVPVCSLLSWLVDRNLEKASHRWQPRLVPRDADDAVVVDIASEDAGPDVEAELPVVEDEEEDFAGAGNEGATGVSLAGPWVVEDRGAIVTDADATQWRIELERVKALLPRSFPGNSSEWRLRLGLLEAYVSVDCGSVAAAAGGIRHPPSTAGSVPIGMVLRNLCASLDDHLERVERGERMLNSDRRLRTMTEEFAGVARASVAAAAGAARLEVEVGRMKVQHDSLVEAVEAARTAVEAAGAGATDSGMVQKIRGALQVLREEIRGMDLRIAFVQHELEHARMRAQIGDDSIFDVDEV